MMENESLTPSGLLELILSVTSGVMGFSLMLSYSPGYVVDTCTEFYWTFSGTGNLWWLVILGPLVACDTLSRLLGRGNPPCSIQLCLGKGLLLLESLDMILLPSLSSTRTLVPLGSVLFRAVLSVLARVESMLPCLASISPVSAPWTCTRTSYQVVYLFFPGKTGLSSSSDTHSCPSCTTSWVSRIGRKLLVWVPGVSWRDPWHYFACHGVFSVPCLEV